MIEMGGTSRNKNRSWLPLETATTDMHASGKGNVEHGCTCSMFARYPITLSFLIEGSHNLSAKAGAP
jgi:hypothetical protein